MTLLTTSTKNVMDQSSVTELGSFGPNVFVAVHYVVAYCFHGLATFRIRSVFDRYMAHFLCMFTLNVFVFLAGVHKAIMRTK
jgi:hypothetical protein